MRNLLTPLGVLLLTNAGSQATIEVRPLIARQLSQMRRLVDDLLDIGCVEQGQLSLLMTSLDLSEVIEAAIEVARPVIAAQEHRLMLAPHAPGAVVIEGDRGRLTQAMSNLLINAAKFTPKGGDICVGLEYESRHVKVCIRDTGVGIAQEMLPKIFDVYVHAARGADGTRSGLGLGLVVARKLVEAHGGTLSAHSAGPGRGSEFVMRLPFGVSH
jgi:signal transduction histidine kinase